jgi:hypothetical protein
VESDLLGTAPATIKQNPSGHTSTRRGRASFSAILVVLLHGLTCGRYKLCSRFISTTSRSVNSGRQPIRGESSCCAKSAAYLSEFILKISNTSSRNVSTADPFSFGAFTAHTGTPAAQQVHILCSLRDTANSWHCYRFLFVSTGFFSLQ